jgi:polar amino acid transport system permease protein
VTVSSTATGVARRGDVTMGRTLQVVTLAWVVTAVTLVVVGWTAFRVLDSMPSDGGWRTALSALTAVGVLASLAILRPAIRAVQTRAEATRCLRGVDMVGMRKYRSRSTSAAWVTMGGCVAALCVASFVLFLLANDHAVQRIFLDADMIQRSWVEVGKAFGKNIFIAVVAEAIVLVWGLVLALARLAPGKAGRPISMLATLYIDVFRAVPAIIVIYLVGFGLPLAGVPFLSDLKPTWAAILALSLSYGAYVAEVYRAGITSVHWSQTAAARSLGFSHGHTMRHVVVPQAVRRVVPPLLNDFIGLQKDTALVTVIGTVDAFTQAKIYAGNYFNLSAVTVVALLFIIVTIPQTRFVDRLLARDEQRLGRRS